MNSNKTIEKLRSGEEFSIHRSVGTVRENCVYAESISDVPNFLISDGAISVNEDGTAITLNAVEGPAVRSFPVFVCWEHVSAENAEKVPGSYGAWSKDNGFTTLEVIDGRCFNLPSMVRASLMTTDYVPEWVTTAGFPVYKKGDTWFLNRTDKGEVKTGTVGQAVWCCYSANDINILDINEKSATEYIVTIDGEDIGTLTDVISGIV